MVRLYVIVIMFSFSSAAFSVDLNNNIAQISTAYVSASALSEVIVARHAELIPASTSILLIAIGLALIFLDDHLKKSRDKNKNQKK